MTTADEVFQVFKVYDSMIDDENSKSVAATLTSAYYFANQADKLAPDVQVNDPISEPTPQQRVDTFNANHEIGAPVLYGLNRKKAITKSSVYLKNGTHPCILIELVEDGDTITVDFSYLQDPE